MTDIPRVLILDQEPEPLLTRLEAEMPDIVAQSCDSYAALPKVLETFKPDILYSITFAGRAGYPSDAVLGPHGPCWISVGGSGVDHLGRWDGDRITVTNAAGSAAAAMAEYVFACLLHFTFDIAGLEADRQARHWNSLRMMTPLKGKTLLIVGLGHTGRAVASRAKAFGMHVIGTRSRPKDTPHVDEVYPGSALPELWPQADVIVLSVPLLDSTKGLVDARALAAMKSSAILIDVSRGGVVDAPAMINAMRNGSIAGAALDVFEQEPLPYDSPFWDLPNTIISPHSSSVFEEWTMQSFELFLDNLRNWREGKPLFNVVDPERGY
jgi:phosphoglycerate dehydrogenase-like enzyme